MRRSMVAANWKMHCDRATASALASEVSALARGAAAEVVVCPPLVYLADVRGALSGVALGAQNVHDQPKGAFTGEVSAAMLADVGCSWVIVGHSERRAQWGEDDALINRKLRAALEAGLQVMLCVGERLEERDAGRAREVACAQLAGGLQLVSADQAARVVIAYEPVWAIGTGRTATPEQAQEMHAALRAALADRYDAGVAEGTRILYGGSVKPGNAAELFGQPDVDGGLVGGASLQAESFGQIVAAAAH